MQTHLAQHHALAAELSQGKMLGVLVVQCPDGSIGYLAAYSGNLSASATDGDWFVPPVYDAPMENSSEARPRFPPSTAASTP